MRYTKLLRILAYLQGFQQSLANEFILFIASVKITKKKRTFFMSEKHLYIPFDCL